MLGARTEPGAARRHVSVHGRGAADCDTLLHTRTESCDVKSLGPVAVRLQNIYSVSLGGARRHVSDGRGAANRDALLHTRTERVRREELGPVAVLLQNIHSVSYGGACLI
jgi:hypothetical protein